MELTNNEKAKVFAMYLGRILYWYHMPSDALTYVTTIDGNALDNMIAHDCWRLQTALTPLDKISDEDAIEVGKLSTDARWIGEPDAVGMAVIRNIKTGLMPMFESYAVYQYLISKSYAVPLYFGINHPANGLTAIEVGIAIDKTLTFQSHE